MTKDGNPRGCCSAIHSFCIAFTILAVTIGGTASAQSPRDPMTFRQARRVVGTATPNKIRCRLARGKLELLGTVTNYRSRTLEENSVIPLRDIQRVETLGKDASREPVLVVIYLSGATKQGDYWIRFLGPTAQQDRDQFAEALRWLASHDSEPTSDPAASDNFRAQAAVWRTTAVKPAMPEDARQHKVLAENAVQEKNLDKAIDEYEAALDIFPTWPEGQFNVALICGETGDYDCAIEHMQDYLALVPDAPDAQAAKDKLIIWKDKMAHSQ